LTVSRETVAVVAAGHGLGDESAAALHALLDALSAEEDPPTTVSQPPEALDVHLADSLSGLAIEALAKARAVADVGAGAGFPGLALAAALPDASIDLIEAAARKCAVIRRLGGAAGLPNFRAVAARAEEWALGEGAGAYDVVTVRAVAPLGVLVEYAAPLLRERGALVAWTGKRDEEAERSAVAAADIVGLEPEEVRKVTPFSGARDRHLHVYRKVAPTPARFPRRAGMARKRPLS
jgi:16S rRNA (guanine527-N7)-methyltransferase